ncbi:hypothetical protein CIW54_28075 (plasmid) [Paraburkholderia sp. T12-10]|nr:hypothetical protein CIW54_28075 [Paraburkholderia sp. T12-10]
MSFFKSMYGGVMRDVKIIKLKADFNRNFPGEVMSGTLEGYCGTGMMVAQSLNEGAEDRLRLIEAFELGLMLEKEHHRSFANQAYEIGVSTMLDT